MITIRQTIDPFVDDIQYIRSCEVALEPDGRLSMSKVGLKLGRPGDNFVIISRERQPDNPFPVVCMHRPTSDLLREVQPEMRMMDSCEDGPDLILTIVEKDDVASGLERHIQRIDARDREEQIIYLKQLVTRPWNWVAPIFSQKSSSPATSIAAPSHCPAPIPITPRVLQPGNAVSTSVNKGTASGLVHRRRSSS